MDAESEHDCNEALKRTTAGKNYESMVGANDRRADFAAGFRAGWEAYEHNFVRELRDKQTFKEWRLEHPGADNEEAWIAALRYERGEDGG